MRFCLFILWVNLFTHFIEGRLVKTEHFGIPRIADIDGAGDNKRSVVVIFNRECLDLELNDTNNDVHGDELNEDEVFVLQHHMDSVLDTYPQLFSARYNKIQSKYYEDMDHQTLAFINCNGNEAETGNVFADIMNEDECIDYIDYAPILKIQQNPEPAHDCVRSSIPLFRRTEEYGLDLMTSLNPDNTYTFPADVDIVDLYILDTGIDVKHEEFKFNDVYRYVPFGESDEDENSHGTHVAGIAGGLLSGISKGFDIHSYKVCNATGHCPFDWTMAALQAIIERLNVSSRRAVINLSLGSKGTGGINWYDSKFKKIIELGGIVVVAAGNENDDSCKYQPAAAQSAITVGSFNQYRRKSDFSNWGECTDIWAPGSNIYSSVPLGRYEYMQGTSMAAPYIVGMIANILAINDDLELDTIRKILENDAAIIIDGPCDDDYGCFGAVYECNEVWSNDNTQWKPPRMADPSVYEIPSDAVTDNDAMIVGAIIAVFCICCCCIAIAVFIMRKKKRQNSEECGGRLENMV